MADKNNIEKQVVQPVPSSRKLGRATLYKPPSGKTAPVSPPTNVSPSKNVPPQVIHVQADADQPQPVQPRPAKPKPAKSVRTPGKPVTPAGKKPKAAPRQNTRSLAKDSMSSIVDDMKAVAEKRGGYLTLADIEDMQSQFDQRADELASSLEASFEQYADARERAAWNKKRNYEFDRLIVKKFSALFEDQSRGRAARVSRRILPGFFLALEMMLGAEILEQHKDECHVIVEKIRERYKDEFSWNHVYQSFGAETVIMDVLVLVAAAFSDLDKRANWFINLVNGHLSPPRDDADEDARWELTPFGFKLFLAALLSDLTKEVASEKGRIRLTARHGAEACDTILNVVRQLTKNS